MQVIRHYERSLTSLALRRLASVPGTQVYGIGDPDQSAHRMPNIFFGIEGLKPVSIAGALADRGIRVGHGNCGCPRAVRAAGLPEDTGAVCLSLAHYNSEEEVERLSEALHDVVHG
jgi:selenocysteine lyase/cysteine desulfurase